MDLRIDAYFSEVSVALTVVSAATKRAIAASQRENERIIERKCARMADTASFSEGLSARAVIALMEIVACVLHSYVGNASCRWRTERKRFLRSSSEFALHRGTINKK
jgi:putative N-acetylmannosamine-6-phosphate epimerase